MNLAFWLTTSSIFILFGSSYGLDWSNRHTDHLSCPSDNAPGAKDCKFVEANDIRIGIDEFSSLPHLFLDIGAMGLLREGNFI